MPTEPTITCPSCQTEIKLTESLAAPLLAQTRQQYEEKLKTQSQNFAKQAKAIEQREKELAQKQESIDTIVKEKIDKQRQQLDEKTAQREKELKQRAAELEKQKESVDETVTRKLADERKKITEQETKKAKAAANQDIEKKAKEISELNEILKQRDGKLAKAQKAEAQLIRKQRELDDAKREMALTIEKQVQENLAKARQKAKAEAEEQLSLKITEKDETITSMKKTIEDLKRKSEQGSQQSQGEAFELQLESKLAQNFSHDDIEPVPKGEHGGDVLQRVHSAAGTKCGTILWESKRTKNWSGGWLAKLREDQRQARADVAIITSFAMPQNVETFEQIEGVWVVHPRYLLPVASCLRQMLIEVNSARQTSEGVATKAQMMYQYLTGSKFRLRVQAIVEAFSTMEQELAKEKRAIQRQWAKRETQINRVMEATTGMYGDLQGIAGQSLQEIEGLELEDEGDDAGQKRLG